MHNIFISYCIVLDWSGFNIVNFRKKTKKKDPKRRKRIRRRKKAKKNARKKEVMINTGRRKIKRRKIKINGKTKRRTVIKINIKAIPPFLMRRFWDLLTAIYIKSLIRAKKKLKKFLALLRRESVGYLPFRMGCWSVRIITMFLGFGVPNLSRRWVGRAWMKTGEQIIIFLLIKMLLPREKTMQELTWPRGVEYLHRS